MGPAKQRAMRLFMITNIIFIVALLLLISSQSQRVAFRVQDRGVDATNQSNVPRAVDRGSDDDSNASGGFIQKCAYPGANFTSHYLGVYCLNNDVSVYGYNYSWIDLNKCVGNSDGTLTGQPSGNYTLTCAGCTMSHSVSLYLECACWTINAQLRQSRVDLNTFISDEDGAISCYGQVGSKTWRPGPPTT